MTLMQLLPISIGICTSNDEFTINSLLKSLVKSFSNKELNIQEIIIVSSGCKDKTEIIITKYLELYPEKVFLLKEDRRKGKASALNQIFKRFRGEALILLPADVVVQDRSLLFLKNKLISNAAIGIVSGSPILAKRKKKLNSIGKMADILWNLHNDTLNLKNNTHATGELMIIRSKAVSFIPEYIINDDAYLAIKTIRKSYLIEYEKKAKVFISIPNTITDYITQRKRVLLGHKQLKHYENQNTTTLKELFKKDKIRTFQLISKELRNIHTVPYFTLAVFLEFYIEGNLFFSKDFDSKDNIIWKRVDIINPNV